MPIGSAGQTRDALEPLLDAVGEVGGDAADQEQQPEDDRDSRGGDQKHKAFDPPGLGPEPDGPGVQGAPGMAQQTLGPLELGGPDRQPDEDDQPAGARERHQDQTDDDDDQADAPD